MERASTINGESSESVLTNNQLDPSELGTKEYWDALYNRELENYSADPEDEGTIWFDESNAEAVVRRQLDKLATQGLLHRSAQHGNSSVSISKPARFLDLGTGNGHMLFSLCSSSSSDDEEEGKEPNWASTEMIGVDYSPTSIELARRIASQRHDLPSPPRFEHWDLLDSGPFPDWLGDGFDVVLDKGTFDAISLMPSSQQEGSRSHPCEIYRDKVVPLIRRGKFLIVTSCNWTRDELVQWLAPERDGGGGELRFLDEAVYPTFTFGGRKGQSVVTVVFRRRHDENGK